MSINRNMQRVVGGLKRTALSTALGVCFVGGAYAQSNTSGAISGRAAAGETVTITNPATGLTRSVTVGADGSYRFSALPTGQYTVTTGAGGSRNVSVNVGTASNADFTTSQGGATTLDSVTVVGSSAVNPIDVSSVESTTILTAEQIAKIPVGRDATSVALLAPGTVRGDAAFGNLASFGGSSVAENQYFVNGFNITNTFRGLNFTQVPFEAIAEQQVKTGGYGAEFGRSLGGVINQITKRGGNEFHAGANIFYEPESLREETLNTYYSNPLVPDTLGQIRQDNSKDKEWQATASVWASGALIKDRLFAYGLVQYRREESDTWNSVVNSTNTSAKADTPNWVVKLDWQLSDNHLLEFTGISDKQDTETDVYGNTLGRLDRTRFIGTNFQESGGDNYILKYTGYLTDNFTLSALGGIGKSSRSQHLRTAAGLDVRYNGDLNNPATGCPIIADIRPQYRRDLTSGGLPYVSTCNITGGAIQGFNNEDTRHQFRLDAEWQLADHRLQFGLDLDNFESIAGTSTEGGRVWRYATSNGDDTLPNTGDEYDLVREQIVNQGSSNEIKQRAFYIQDNWNVTDNFMAYLGLRWDTFDNRDGFGNSFVKVENQLGPRLGFSWDINGDSTFKLFGNAGRYALPLTADVATRGASASVFTRQNFRFTGVDPVSGAPLGLTPINNLTYINGEFGEPKNPQTIAAKDLDPMYQDEYILGFQAALSDHVNLGVRAIYRDLKAAIDDNCDYTAIMDSAGFTQLPNGAWRDQAGRFAELPGAGFPYCRIFNPGEDAVFMTDLYGDGNLTAVHVDGARLSPKAKRTYSAIELFMDGSWDNFFFQGSYTYGKSKGNTEGGVKSDIGQANTNTTQDFDYLELTENTYGYLPNDRRHSLKLFGNYEFSEEWSLGANLIVQSGRPLNCFGVYAPWPSQSGFHPYGSSFMRCGTTEAGQALGPDGEPTNNVQEFPRGTKGRLPWTRNLDLNLRYAPLWAKGLQFKVDVFNVFNEQKVTSVNETAEDVDTGIPLDTYMLPLSFQAPRSFRFMVQYDF
ncbi:TonB-dependent receptor [Pseudoxanthomonas indica]|uniref:Carboxypeptidase regulatory-like domain-containing protein n=1 Tax=Pseudoxanthomonas indica TaxID=428993 RepID=A0A1T5KBT1_9GAMM|nr:TonB-dependent receptor [Pseudoxanthomonas indica]GGD48273.1 Oar protein [Pseudoxanthomonas indica]SKC61104.1 Carboxypeptidase regulatory-like domain-containing protein [Pseudoxanthomonas indica]